MPKTRRRVQEHPLDAQANKELERIKARLIPEGYKLRRSPNDRNAWRCAQKGSTTFYLLCRPQEGGWKVLPLGTEPERETLVKLISEALQ